MSNIELARAFAVQGTSQRKVIKVRVKGFRHLSADGKQATYDQATLVKVLE